MAEGCLILGPRAGTTAPLASDVLHIPEPRRESRMPVDLPGSQAEGCKHTFQGWGFGTLTSRSCDASRGRGGSTAARSLCQVQKKTVCLIGRTVGVRTHTGQTHAFSAHLP